MTLRNRQTSRKKRNIRMEMQREMLKKRQIENSDFQYQPTLEVYSEVKCQLHELGLTRDLPGRDALKEVLIFLKTYQPKQRYTEYYVLALKAALKKVKSRRFVDSDEQIAVVTNLDDVTQIMRESLRAAGIKDIPVKDFIYSLL